MTESGGIFGNLIKNIEAQTESQIKINEGDYQVDGLWYCCKCDTPKQTKVILFGSERKPMCLCKCETEKRDMEYAEIKRKAQMDKVKELRKMGFPESDMENWTFAKDDLSNPKITQIAQNYVEHFAEMRERGKGLMFYGTVGTGKTFISACIANALIDKGYPVLVTNFARLVNTISGMYDGKQNYIDGLNRFSLLIIDDLAAERDTEFMNEIVQNIIDSRYRAGLPIIVTTNLSGNEIKNPADIRKQRTYSRLLEMTIPIEVNGKDRRKEKLKDDFTELKDLLGL